MDVLKNKYYKQRNYISRYTNFPVYYHTLDNKYIQGITGHLSIDSIYVDHKLKPEDSLHSLALKYYGRPDYYWIIADFNRINDPFIHLSDKYKSIKIPSMGNITFED